MSNHGGGESPSGIDGEVKKDERDDSMTPPESGYRTGQQGSLADGSSSGRYVSTLSWDVKPKTQSSQQKPCTHGPSTRPKQRSSQRGEQPPPIQPPPIQPPPIQPPPIQPPPIQPPPIQPPPIQPRRTRPPRPPLQPRTQSPAQSQKHNPPRTPVSGLDAQDAEGAAAEDFSSDQHQQSHTSGAVGTSMMRDSAVKELYETVTKFLRWRLGVDIVHWEYVSESEGEEPSWFRIATQQKPPIVQDLSKLLYFIKLNLRHLNTCKDLHSRLIKTPQNDENFQQAVDGWLNAKKETVEEFARKLKCHIVKLLDDQGALLPVKDDERFFQKTRKKQPLRQQRLFKALELVQELHFLLENGTEDLKKQKLEEVNRALKAVEKLPRSNNFSDVKKDPEISADFTQFLEERMERWRKRVSDGKQIKPSTAISLMRGIVDQILIYQNSLGLIDFVKQAKRANLLDVNFEVHHFSPIANWRHRKEHSMITDTPSTDDESANFNAYVEYVMEIMKQLESHFTKKGIDCTAISKVLNEHIQRCARTANSDWSRSGDHTGATWKKLFDANILNGEILWTLSQAHLDVIKDAQPIEGAQRRERAHENLTEAQLLHTKNLTKCTDRFFQQGSSQRSSGSNSQTTDHHGDSGSDSNPPPSNGQPRGAFGGGGSGGGASGGGDSQPTDGTNQPESQQGGSNSNFSGSAGDRPAGNVQNYLGGSENDMGSSNDLSLSGILSEATVHQPDDDSLRSTGTGMVLPSSGAMGGHKNQDGEHERDQRVEKMDLRLKKVEKDMQCAKVIVDGEHERVQRVEEMGMEINSRLKKVENNMQCAKQIVAIQLMKTRYQSHPQNLPNKDLEAQSTPQSYSAQYDGSGDNPCANKSGGSLYIKK